MKQFKIVQVLLFMFIFSLITSGQENNDVKIIVLSQEIINSPIITDLPPVGLRVNLRIKNDSQKDIYIFGSKYGKDFDPLFHIVTYDDNQKQWKFPAFTWEQATEDEKETYRIKKGGYFDLYTILPRKVGKRRYKATIYYSDSKKEKPSLLESEEFWVDKVQ